ncbi:MAG: glycoside hydrolase family 3 C-terminal domain-containing protein [Bacteroidaceae bacterium]|nr:glycoside hydrolase family 3 C-terminal domain-containing protein [Bacteroidaceae bacterium]
MKHYIATLALALTAITGNAQETLPYQNPKLSSHERAVDLLSRLTIEEKAKLMLDESEAIPRLGIKKFSWWSEALHGYANQGNVSNFPEPIGMAASFNDDLVYKVFDATSTEIRAKYNERLRNNQADQRFFSLSVWTPNINIFRDPRWGRGQETYGEDPYLTSRMGVAVINGLQGPRDAKYKKTLACAKHYAIHSGPEWSRHSDNINDVSPRDLWETYMPAFKAAVQEGDVREVMCAYQRWDDEPCCGSNRLLQQILRDEWGFKYMVVSDCGAVSDFWTSHKSSSTARHAATKGVLAGTDVECGYDYAYRSIPEAVRSGMLSEKEVDKRVIRLLEGRFDLGEMDKPEEVSWFKLPMTVVDSKEHRKLAHEIAQQTMVLLQNNNNILPLPKSIKKVAVVGPNADDETMMWGNYNGNPNETVTILEGIQNKIGKKRIVSLYGCDLVNDLTLESFYDQCSFEGKKGLKGTFWNNPKREGTPVTTLQVTRPLNVTTMGNYAFAPGVNLKDFSAKYETVFKPKESGEVAIRFNGCSYFELLVDGKSMTKHRTWRTTDTHTVIKVEAGKEYKIELLFAQVENWNANLSFDLGREHKIDYTETVYKVKDCDAVIFVGGISPRLEGEEMPIDLPGFKGGDRLDIELPAVQRNLMKAFKDAGKKVIFVNCSGSAIALSPETQSCEAILQAWYAGEQGGNAVADVLFGDYNPSGKLPVTFYKNTKQLPDYKDYSMKGRTYRYFNDALFPFGYGLSYTKFDVSNGKFDSKKEAITVDVKNSGAKNGTEVVQIYIRRCDDTDGPLKSLRAYQRVDVAAGKTVTATIPLPRKAFELFDPSTNTMRVKPGKYEIFYGTSSRNEDLKKMQVDIQ